MRNLRAFYAVLVIFALCTVPAAFSQDGLNETAKTAMLGISKIFTNNFDSSQTLGTPVEAGDYIIIPVVCKFAGFGFGTKLEAKDREAGPVKNGKTENDQRDRLGLGGGAFVKPVALIFVKKDGEYKVVKLAEGFVSQIAKHMVPAMAKIIKDGVKKMAKKYKGRTMGPRGKKMEKEKRIIIRKKLQKELQGEKKFPVKPKANQ